MQRLNPIEMAEEVQRDYLHFFLMSFSPNNEKFMKKLEEIPKKTSYLWKGPYLAIPPRAKQGEKFKDFESRRISKEIKNAFPYIHQLYKHQESAIRHILNGNNTIVSVPTGSGKTEIFLIPIIQYCYDHRLEKGTKAILIYPMNALAKDQVERLRRILWNINKKLHPHEKITFAIYTGDTPKDRAKLKEELLEISETCPLSKEEMEEYGCPKYCERNNMIKYDADKETLYCPINPKVVIDYQILTRESIQKNPPDIIITNYVQLEHILSRKEDTTWLESGSLKYIVLDEIHTYTGSKGIDIAFLIRRLKKASKSNPICIGTSATISKETNDIKRRESIAKFASTIFGVDITHSDVIEAEFEDIEFPKSSFIPGQLKPFDETIDKIKDIDSIDISLLKEILDKINPNFSTSTEYPPSLELGKALLENKFFQILIGILKTPKSVEEIIQDLKDNTAVGELIKDMDEEILKKIIWSYLKLASKCRDPYNPSLPLINVNIHLFMKTFERLYQCNECGKIYTLPKDKCERDGSNVDEIGVCRFCGHIFNIVYVDKEEFKEWYEYTKHIKNLNKNKSKILDILPKQHKKSYLKKLSYRNEFSNKAVQIWISDDPSFESSKDYIEIKRCPKCGSLISDISRDSCPVCGYDKLYLAYAFVRESNDYTDTRPISCPYCGNRYGRYSALSAVTMSSDTASVVAFDRVYTKLPDEYKKLLIFTDNRQIASYLAKHLEDTHFDHTIRVLIYYLLKKEGRMSLPKLSESAYDIVRYWSYEGLGPKMLETAILEELCSLRGRQRSLENLGLLKIIYYGLENEKDFEDLWNKFISEIEVSIRTSLQLENVELWREIITSVADIIRQKGAVEGLNNNPFGRSEVIGFALSQKYEGRFIKVIDFLSKGRTKQRLLLQKIFGKDKVVDDALKIIFRFLIYSRILKEVDLRCCGKRYEKARGYVIDKKSIIIEKPKFVYKCKKCHRIHLTSPNNICMTYNCDGTTEKIRYDVFEKEMRKHNYYFTLYQKEEPIKMVTAVDTGAIPIRDRHILELEFKKKDVEERKIDVIVATPTLELGVDIGDLISVGIYKAPPSPANYVQRVGRAGRKEKISFNVTFLYLSPLDRYYYENPEELIRGIFEAPKIDIENRYVLQKHVNAIVLYNLMKRSWSNIPRLFKEFAEKKTVEKIYEEIDIPFFKNLILSTLEIPTLQDIDIELMLKSFINDLSWATENFKRELEWYRSYEQELVSQKNYDSAKRIRELINKLEEVSTVSYLMDMSILPRYAFPGTYVEVRDIYGKEDFEGRSRNIAITELAPLMRVFMKKKIYKSVGIDMEILKPKEKIFYVCPRCGKYITENPESLKTKGCPVCGYKPRKGELTNSIIQSAIEPNIIYVREEKDMNFQLREYQEAFSRIYLSQVSDIDTRVSKIDPSIRLTRYHNSEIVKIVDKVIINKEEVEIKICEKCGRVLERLQDERNHFKLGTSNERCNGRFRKFVLYHRMPTNVVSIKFLSNRVLGNKIENTEEFLITLKNAILNASQRMLYAQDGEIDGDVDVEEMEILIYDNVEGGAGYSDEIYERFEEILKEAYRIASTCECDKGCPNCLWSYWRKRDIPKIDKNLIIPPLSKILSISEKDIFSEEQLNKIKQEYECGNAKTIITDKMNGATKLKELLMESTDEVYLTSLYVTDTKIFWPDGKHSSWVDILSLLSLKGVKINLIVKPPKGEGHINALNRLRSNGVNVYIYEKETKDEYFKGIVHAKIAVIDPFKESCNVIFTSANLSPEMTKNVDFYIISRDKQCVKKTLYKIKEIISRAKRL